MKLKYEFIVREIAGEYVMVPMGAAALEFSGMASTNAVGAFICEKLKQETTPEAVLDSICREFEIDRATAQADLNAFLDDMRKVKLLDE